MAKHTSAEFELELREIRGQLVAMGARCERAVQVALSAFLERDETKVAEVLALDEKVNQDEIQLDDMAIRVLALRQPVAYDLRFVASTLKFVTDLERISDEAVNLVERIESLKKVELQPPVFDIPLMGELAQKMLREALDAFIEGDEQRARRVLTADDEVDDLLAHTLQASLAWMSEHPRDVAGALCVVSAAKYLERIADHATNLAEHVIYLEKGDDVRHRRMT
jgi:phosphate transport system protein